MSAPLEFTPIRDAADHLAAFEEFAALHIGPRTPEALARQAALNALIGDWEHRVLEKPRRDITDVAAWLAHCHPSWEGYVAAYVQPALEPRHLARVRVPDDEEDASVSTLLADARRCLRALGYEIVDGSPLWSWPELSSPALAMMSAHVRLAGIVRVERALSSASAKATDGQVAASGTDDDPD